MNLLPGRPFHCPDFSGRAQLRPKALESGIPVMTVVVVPFRLRSWQNYTNQYYSYIYQINGLQFWHVLIGSRNWEYASNLTGVVVLVFISVTYQSHLKM